MLKDGTDSSQDDDVRPLPSGIPARVDERFSQLILDHFAPRHLFIAEGAGARSILDLLQTAPEAAGKKLIAYADTARDLSPGYADCLQGLDGCDCHIYSTRLDLVRALPAMLSQMPQPYRVYVAGSDWFLKSIEELAERAGTSRDQIMIERCDPRSRAVCCLACGRETISCAEDVLHCAGCGTALRITSYYRRDDHAHLAVPIDWDLSVRHFGKFIPTGEGNGNEQ